MKLSDYTFETFIDAPSNHLAHLAAKKICETPGVYNPLCIETQTPSLDATTKIVSEKLQNNGIEWPIDACRYVAYNISSSIRQIEGEINKILVFKELF